MKSAYGNSLRVEIFWRFLFLHNLRKNVVFMCKKLMLCVKITTTRTMCSTYNVSMDIPLFRRIILEVFGRRELLTIMSVIVCYNEAHKEASNKGLLYATINYHALCKEAEDDGIDRDTIKTVLEKLSVL